MSKQYLLSIQTPTDSFINDSVVSFTVKISNGYIGILKDHTPIISNIKPCMFEIKRNDNSKIEYGFISSGIIFVDKKETKVICEKVVWDFDVNKKDFEDELNKVEEKLKTATDNAKESLLQKKEFYRVAIEGVKV